MLLLSPCVASLMSIARTCSIPMACILLSACAARPPAPATPVAQAVAPSADAVADGVYNGTSTRFQADRRDCPHPGLVTLVVQAQRFEFRWSYGISVDAAVDPDGSVRGLGPDLTLTGRLDGRTLSGDVTNGACGLHFTARREV